MVVVEKKMEHEALKRNEYGCTVRVESSAGVWGGEGGVQGGEGGGYIPAWRLRQRLRYHFAQSGLSVP